MKKVLASLLLVGSMNAFAGYTAEVCTVNEAGQKTQCRMVHFNRDLGVVSSNQERVVCNGEAMNTICEKPGAHVPVLIQKINKFFQGRGYTAPNNDEATDKAGG